MLRRASIAAAAALAGLAALAPRQALANGFEFPSNGTESFGRGSAWLARATDPLAVFHNPAALSRNGNGVSLTANIIWQRVCFDRTHGGGDPVANAVTVGNTEQIYSQVCNKSEPFPNPQLAMQFRLTDKLGVGFAVMGPSAVGKSEFPTTTTNTKLSFGQPNGTAEGPSASRYILTAQESLLIWPQIALGYEVAPNLRVGASLIWGLAFVKFGNVSAGTNDGAQSINPTTGRLNETAAQDLIAKVEAKDLFIPGFVASAMYTIGANIDVAAWFHWSDAIKAKGNAEITSFLYNSKLQLENQTNTQPSDADKAKGIDGSISATVPQPWDLKLGARYYKPRPGVTLTQKGGLLKDPLRDEVFDVGLDLQYSNDSQFDTLSLSFDDPRIVVFPGTSTGSLLTVPADASVPHKWKNSFGARLGGDYNLLPERLALRAGVWFQTSSIDPKYMHLDFIAAQRVGLTVGGTVRLGPADIQLGYGHIFFQDLDNKGAGEQRALTGTANANPPNRSAFAVNGGKISASANIVSAGAVLRW